MALDLTQHPCFNADVRHTTGRIHLPVAAKCNIQCNYCDRKFDCMNESRPGVTSAVLEPRQALAYLDKVLERVPQLKVVGIAGPGDPFANADETMETLRLVREKYPEMLLCVASNGLNVEPYAEQLAKLQVSHVTITMNAVDPEIGEKIYSWVRDHKTIYRGAGCGAASAGAPAFGDQDAEGGGRDHQDQHDPSYRGSTKTMWRPWRCKMRELGADIMNCIPLLPVADTPFAENLGEVAPAGGEGDSGQGCRAAAADGALLALPRRRRRACWAPISLRNLSP